MMLIMFNHVIHNWLTLAIFEMEIRCILGSCHKPLIISGEIAAKHSPSSWELTANEWRSGYQWYNKNRYANRALTTNKLWLGIFHRPSIHTKPLVIWTGVFSHLRCSQHSVWMRGIFTHVLQTYICFHTYHHIPMPWYETVVNANLHEVIDIFTCVRLR